MSVSAFKRMGRVHYHKRVFTYYSPNGSHIYGLGAYTSDGTYTLNGRDKNGYLILANNKKFGTKIKTPLASVLCMTVEPMAAITISSLNSVMKPSKL
ncbi:hypothetical protein [Secundilactobacillus odoratitofui]|uniref:hypothetical protein n=1 Tax=Secundilactobacillus odoratitofui TaxID=480930 RepID=UPI00209354A0|nr:hypothetical protein [Secundilactobacillus odoratitofui]